MTTWQELTAIATLGTERRAPQPVPQAGALGALLASLDPADPEGWLLGAAAALGLARRAGQLAAPAPAPAPAPSPADTRPACTNRSAQHLLTILAGQYRATLPEWLAACQAAGRRVAPTALPELLDYARSRSELHTSVRAVLGERGTWLATQNPAWGYAARTTASDPASYDTLWQTGEPGVRRALLAERRTSDPAAARGLLEATWASEKADDRATFLGLLAHGLSLADQPFLEAALDDRAKEVRRAAAELLGRMPNSQLTQRQCQRALALLSWQGRSPVPVVVTLPAACDKAMQRDGIDPRPPPTLGEKAWWLTQLLRATPPATWCQAWGVSASQILGTRLPSEWRGLLLRAWADAALRYHDAEWIDQLVTLAASEANELQIEDLVGALSAERREALLFDLLRDPLPLGQQHPALAPLRRSPGPWSRRLARAVLERLKRRLNQGDRELRNEWALREALSEFALVMPPELATEAAAGWNEGVRQWPYWGQAIDDCIGTLEFRAAMLHEFI